MRLVFDQSAWDDYTFWLAQDRTHDPAMVKRINRLIADMLRNPFAGIGKPERLSQNLSGAWSRRIDEEHRLVYLIDGNDLVILQARYHYEP